MTRVTRPIVRSFKARFFRECAAWVQSGGHGVFWESEGRARLVFPTPANDVTDLGYWSVLDLGLSNYETHTRGKFTGLSSVVVPKDCNDVVQNRAERDSIHAGPTRTVSFDCLACGACCKDNEVVLEKADYKRFAEGGRPELGKPPLAMRRGRKIMLTLLADKSCRHLQSDNKCAIYTLRPNACSEFPVASECCLFAREDGYGLRDGAPAPPG